MRKLIVDYGESTEINKSLKNSLNSLEKELRNTEEAIQKIESLEGGYRYSSEILNELYSQKREIEKSYDEINYFQGNFTNFIEKVKTTDEDLAKNFKGRVESYCKENKIEITSDFDEFLDKVQAVLDVAGFIPGVGDICDFINAGISLLRGHWLEAGICLIAMIPFCDMIKSLKYSDEAAKLLKYGDEAIDGVKTIAKEGVEKTAKQNSKFLRRGEKADKMFSTIDLGDEFAVTYKNGATDTISKASTTAEGSRCLGNGCFVAGTLVHTEEGIKKIEDIKIGDRVLSFNEETSRTSYKEVVDTIERSTYEICTIEHSNGKIQSTTGHLFMVQGKWWTSAVDIKAGDKLVLGNGEVTDVLDVSVKEGSYPIKTYNLSVDENHTFFVDNDGVLTHNTANIKRCATTKGVSKAEQAISRIDEIEVKFNYKSKYDEAEFARQLADQEASMNKLTVDEYLKNRERYIAEGRAIEGNAAQQAARKEAQAQKIAELRKNGLSYSEAKKQAEEWLKSQAALHNPDQIAGGNPLNIGGIGDSKINSSIGSQWKYRIDAVDEQIKALADKMTEAERKSKYLNVKLKY